MDPIERIIKWVLRNPIWAASIVAWIVLTVRAKWKEAADAKGTKDPRGPRAPRGGGPTARPDESDLEARVRRNFEEMLRRRQAAASPPQAPPGPVPTAAALPVAARRKPVDYDERVRPEPTSTEPSGRAPVPAEVALVRKAKETSRHLEAAAHAVRGNVRAAGSARSAKRLRADELRRLVLEPRSLRRAILMREILDPPVSLK